jgi:outer membrane protein OmpA-like peptidoglycan-associated protein
MTLFRLAFPLVASFLYAIAPASAQKQLTDADIITSLQGVETVAMTLNTAALRQQAQDNVRSNRHPNATGRPSLAPELDKLRQLYVEIDFDLNSAAIRPDSFRIVGAMADALHHPYLLEYKFLIVGHTDATGGRKYNLDLSERRAQAIREALVTTFRIPPARVEALGLGEEQLRDPAHPEAAQNRRVQLINIGKLRRP